MKPPNSKWSGTSAQTLKDGDKLLATVSSYTVKEWTIGPNTAAMNTKTWWKVEIASTALKYGPYKTRTRAKERAEELVSS